MFWTTNIRKVKIALLAAAAAIAGLSLVWSHLLTRELFDEEVGKMEVWAEAMRSLIAADETTDLNLVLRVINSNNTIPVVVTDAGGTVLAARNLMPEPSGRDSLAMVNEAAKEMRESGRFMRMNLAPTASAPADMPAASAESAQAAPDNGSNYIYIYYEESVMLRRLSAYPYIQLGVVAFFMLVAIFALLASKRAEQNRVWVGLSRETAHQLGTPISSLMAWSEVLRETYPDDPLLPEMDKDVRRLQLIAERFSKIGSAPELVDEDLRAVVARVVEYLDHRTSQKVGFTLKLPPYPLPSKVNAPLFEWVIENLCKNAVDAMSGCGHITITMKAVAEGARIEVSDTGKGISRKHFKTIFKPGFTTKKRGWGLGLSLAKRIIEEYHHGRIYVKSSEPGHGTTFAIDLG